MAYFSYKAEGGSGLLNALFSSSLLSLPSFLMTLDFYFLSSKMVSANEMTAGIFASYVTYLTYTLSACPILVRLTRLNYDENGIF